MCMPLTLFSSRISCSDWRNALCYFIFSQCSWGTCFYALPLSTLNRWYPWHLTLCQQKDLRVLLFILPVNHLKFLMESTCSSIVNLPGYLFVVFVFFFLMLGIQEGRQSVRFFSCSIFKKCFLFFQFDFQEKVLCIIQKGNRNKKFAFTDIKGFDSEVSFASCSDKL